MLASIADKLNKLIKRYYVNNCCNMPCVLRDQVLTLLGPKTEEDLAKPTKAAKKTTVDVKEKKPSKAVPVTCNGAAPETEQGTLVTYLLKYILFGELFFFILA